jgi:hypothetical protein
MSKITYLEDLAKELEEEFGLSEKEALEICKLNIDHVYNLIREPNIISIRFPMLGVLHLNLKKAKYSKVYKEFEELIDKQVDIIKPQYDEERDLVHGRTSLLTTFKKYFYKDYKERNRARATELFNKIEKKQNK